MTDLNKLGQLSTVMLGFFATVLVLATGVSTGHASVARAALTLAIALSCAVRYWWVILLLPWPFRVLRTTLLLSGWCALVLSAATIADAQHWAFSLAALVAIGCATEVYNGLTGQWQVGPERLSESLKRDHIVGALSDGLSAIVLALAGWWLETTPLELIVATMTLGTWIQLATMVRRHRAQMGPESTAGAP